VTLPYPIKNKYGETVEPTGHIGSASQPRSMRLSRPDMNSAGTTKPVYAILLGFSSMGFPKRSAIISRRSGRIIS
jgi:hypothetical protein